jgi:hypothetical protein
MRLSDSGLTVPGSVPTPSRGAAWVGILLLACACSGGENRIGTIRLTSQNNGMSWGSARFVTLPAVGQCATSMIDGCEVTECVDEGTPTVSTLHSAGDITVAGVHVDGGLVIKWYDSAPECTQDCPAYVSPPDFLPALWDGGETLTASAAGQSVPAFSGKTVTAPKAITVTAPNCPGVGLPTGCGLSRATDLTVAWTGGADTSVQATLTSNTQTRHVAVTCRFASSPGTIGAAAMAKLDKDDAGHSNFLWIYGSNQTTFTAGGYDVTLEASNSEFGTFVTFSN